MNSSFKLQLKDYLSSILNTGVESFNAESVHGGSINEVYKLVTDQKLPLCCKLNDANIYPGMFAAEKKGLEILSDPGMLRIPKVYGHTVIDSKQVLILEWINEGQKTKLFWQKFGERLSELHAVTATQFGADHNNYMGALTQSNHQHSTWSSFLFYERILPQVRLAIDGGWLQRSYANSIEKLTAVIDSMFGPCKPSLVHGDPWSGNFLCDENNEPVLIDPAVYFGHPSVDLGLTTLFGGYADNFYEAYHHAKPFPDNFREQWEMCNLYPLLIHLNLFGGGYLPDVLSVLNKYGV